MIKGGIKKWLEKKGYTVIKTRLKDVEQMIPPELPASFFENSRVCGSREEVLNYLPKGGVVAEIGVGYGVFSALLIEKLEPQKFIAIDSFAFTVDTEPWKQTFLKDSGLSHLDYYKKKFRHETEKGRIEIRAGISWEMLAQLPDHSLDYAYLDAGHTYEEVASDIEQLKKKMKATGIIQFNDYTLFDSFAFVPYGVPKAVNEFMLQENYEVLFFCLHPQFFCDVVVRKKK